MNPPKLLERPRLSIPKYGRDVTDRDRAEWVGIANEIRETPEILTRLEDRNPKLLRLIEHGLRVLTIEAASEQWRSKLDTVGGRPEQLIPGTPGSFSDRVDWTVWLLMGGRGSGKSRTGAEATREFLLNYEWHERPKWALVGQTLSDVRVNMVENTLLEVLPEGSVRKWNRGTCELWLSNGAFLKGYSSDAARSLRGPNFHGAWADELATWTDADRSPNVDSTTWSNLKMAVRLHDNRRWTPRIIGTTTPKSVRLLRNPDPDDVANPGLGLYDDKQSVVSNMSTYANVANLAEHFISGTIAPLKGTRIFAQEVEGILLDEALGALWSGEQTTAMRRDPTWPEFQGGGVIRTVVAVDPSVGGGTGDECGIVVVGLCMDGRAYVLEDASCRAPAATWAKEIARMYTKWHADVVVAEINNGGELVGETLGRYAPNLPLSTIWAKRGKLLRAEPVAVLSDADKVRFAGDFPLLTRQMRTWDPTTGDDSPDRLDAFVYGVLYLLPVPGGSQLMTINRGGLAR